MNQLMYKTTNQKIDEIYREVVQNDNLLDFLNLISIGVGFYNMLLNKQQISNTELMEELKKQDNEYFEKIVSLLNDIKGDNNDKQHDDEKCDN